MKNAHVFHLNDQGGAEVEDSVAGFFIVLGTCALITTCVIVALLLLA